MSFNRVLPQPLAIYHDLITGRDFTRRSSSLLDHKIMNGNSTQGSSSVSEAASNQDSVTNSPMRINSESSRHNSSGLEVRNPEDAPLSPLTTRKRAATLTTSDTTPIRVPISNPSQAQELCIDSSAHFCLCQPDPKIPRPRNGT
jgi:HMG box factor, other